MIRKRVAAAVAVLALTATFPLLAQEYNQRLVAKEPAKMGITLCPLRFGGKLNDAHKQLRTGLEDSDPAKRAEGLSKARETLATAIAAGEGDNPASWYLLGRVALAQGDLRGADSAFTRAEATAPDCEVDISRRRQEAWVVLANAGMEKQQAGDLDSAIVLLRDATSIFRDLPHVFENLGILFANAGLTDSAVSYFEQAVAKSEGDSTLVDNRNSATLNMAIMLQRASRHPEAIQVLHRYLGWFPGDKDARRSLVFSFREAGMADSADILETQLVAEFAAMTLDSLEFSDAMAVGVSQFNSAQRQALATAEGSDSAKQAEARLRSAALFGEAAKVFETLMGRNPWSRDAAYNLANTYLALDDKPNLTRAARGLLAIEPLNEDAYRLLGQGYRDRFQDSLIGVAEKLVGLPIHVEVTNFTLGSASAKLIATAMGREASDPAGKRIPPAPVDLIIEFVDAAGTVLASQPVSIPILQPRQEQEFGAEAKVEGVAGWRYRVK